MTCDFFSFNKIGFKNSILTLFFVLGLSTNAQAASVNEVYVSQGASLRNCGPASAAMISKASGVQATINSMRSSIPNDRSFWRLQEVKEAILSSGAEARISKLKIDQYAGVYMRTYLGFNHLVVAWLGADKMVYVLDPKRGYLKYSQSSFKNGLRSSFYVSTFEVIGQ